MNEEQGNEAKKGYTTPNRQGEYARLAKHLPKAIEELGKMLEHPNANVRLGAINKVLDKCLPDLKAMELTGKNGGPIQLNVIAGNGYIPQLTTAFAASAGNTLPGQSPIQSSGVASSGEKDNNSDNGNSKAGASS